MAYNNITEEMKILNCFIKANRSKMYYLNKSLFNQAYDSAKEDNIQVSDQTMERIINNQSIIQEEYQPTLVRRIEIKTVLRILL